MGNETGLKIFPVILEMVGFIFLKFILGNDFKAEQTGAFAINAGKNLKNNWNNPWNNWNNPWNTGNNPWIIGNYP